EDLRSVPVKLETLRMALQSDVGNFARIGGVDNSQCAVAIADKDAIGSFIHPNIVGVNAKIDAADRSIVLSLKKSHRSITAVGDIESICCGHEADALWLFQFRNSTNNLMIFEVDDCDTAVAEFSHEQPLSRQINRHVVDPPAHIAERNFDFKLQRK